MGQKKWHQPRSTTEEEMKEKGFAASPSQKKPPLEPDRFGVIIKAVTFVSNFTRIYKCQADGGARGKEPLA